MPLINSNEIQLVWLDDIPELHGCRVTGNSMEFSCLPPIEMNQTIIFYYDNGRSYTAKNVTEYDEDSDLFCYTQRIKRGNIQQESHFKIPMHDVMAYVVKQGDYAEVTKVKPCAKVDIRITKA